VFVRLGLPDSKTGDELFVMKADGTHERHLASGFDVDWRG
jgi:hypothetical protein